MKLVNLRDYIEQAIDTLKVQAIACNAIIHNNVAVELAITTNPAYLESIFLNLITNALKYKHPARVPVISFDAVTVDNKLELRVKDNGLGIDLAKHRDAMFGMFKTFHGNRDAKGIGLYLSKIQAEALGAEIDVTSEVNLGTVFIIRFPLTGKAIFSVHK